MNTIKERGQRSEVRGQIALICALVLLPFSGQAVSPVMGGGIFNSNTANVVFSDPTKTLFLGASAIPGDYSSTLAASSQLLILTDQTHYPFSIIGSYRNGTNGARYLTGFGTDGHFYTNQYVVISGIGDEHSESSMELISTDVAIALSITADTNTDAAGGKIISAYGNKDNSGSWTGRVFDVSSEGTTTINNPYGQTGTVQYDRPELVLGDIGANNASPSWTYGSLHQKAGHLRIGTYTGSGTSANEGDELDITSGDAKVNGTFHATGAATFTSSGTSSVNGKLVVGTNTDPGIGQQGDIIASRSASTGVYYFGGASGNAYLFFDATNIQISRTLVPAADATFDLGTSGNRFGNAFVAGTTKTTSLNIASGGSTTISTGVGSVKMSTGNAATNTVWIPIQYAGTTYYVPGFTTNSP